jgi:hypothetical protein
VGFDSRRAARRSSRAGRLHAEHVADIEAIHTFDGTETIQSLIVGRDITGVGAFV